MIPSTPITRKEPERLLVHRCPLGLGPPQLVPLRQRWRWCLLDCSNWSACEALLAPRRGLSAPRGKCCLSGAQGRPAGNVGNAFILETKLTVACGDSLSLDFAAVSDQAPVAGRRLSPHVAKASTTIRGAAWCSHVVPAAH
jgi:hypothetical protein